MLVGCVRPSSVIVVRSGCIANAPGDGRLRGTAPFYTAPDRASVDAFHKAALKAGGKDNGKPGLRADYGPNYYAAFAVDPDGYRIEAWCGKKS